MPSINNKTKTILSFLLDKLQNSEYLIIQITEDTALNFQLESRGVKSEWGTGHLYHVASWQIKDEEVVMDRAMAFLIIDKRTIPEAFDDLIAIPCLFSESDHHITLDSVKVSQHLLTGQFETNLPTLCFMADLWFDNLRCQRFVK